MTMEKAERFLWQWNDYAPQTDTFMDRDRAARILRAWRNTSKPDSSGVTSRRVEFIRPGVYRCYQYGESGTMITPRASLFRNPF